MIPEDDPTEEFRRFLLGSPPPNRRLEELLAYKARDSRAQDRVQAAKYAVAAMAWRDPWQPPEPDITAEEMAYVRQSLGLPPMEDPA